MREALEKLQKIIFNNKILYDDIEKIYYFLNIHYAFKRLNQITKQNIQTYFLIKAFESLNKPIDEKNDFLTQLNFVKIFLKDSDISKFSDKLVITLFNHISSGVGVKQIIKKGYDRFIKNFNEYKKSVAEAENLIKESCDIDQKLEELYHELTLLEKITDKKYIDYLLNYLGNEHPLYNKLSDLKKQLEILLPKELDNHNKDIPPLYDFSPIRDKTLVEKQLEKDEIIKFLYSIFFTLLYMKNAKGLNFKNITRIISKPIFELQYPDVKNSTKDKCFLLYIDIYSDQYPEELAGWLEEYFGELINDFKNSNKIDIFLKTNLSDYSCNNKKNIIEIEIYVPNEKKEIKDNAIRTKKSRINEHLEIFYSFIRCLGDDYDVVIDNIVREIINENICCEGEKKDISDKFIKLTIKGSKNCNKNIKAYLDSFKENWKLFKKN